MSLRNSIAKRIEEFDGEQANPLFNSVRGATVLDDVLTRKTVNEAAYVIKGNRVESAETPYQRVKEQYLVVLTCRNFTDKNGADAGDISEQQQQRVFEALSGYQIDELNSDPIMRIGGELISMSDGWHIWQDVYQIEYTQKHDQQT